MRCAVKYFKSREDSLEFWLSFFMILGAVCGSVFCCRMDGTMREELQMAESSMVTASMLAKMDFAGLFGAVLKKRLSTLFLLFLVSMTQISALLFLGVSGYMGFSSAVLICSLTMEGGIWGILRFLAVSLPHAFFYGIVFYVAAWWMPVHKKGLSAVPAAAMAAVTVLGAAAESFVNPWIVAWVFGK